MEWFNNLKISQKFTLQSLFITILLLLSGFLGFLIKNLPLIPAIIAILFFIFLFSAAIFAFNKYFAFKIKKPLVLINKKMNSLTKETLIVTPVKISSNDEFGELSESFNNMIQNISARTKREELLKQIIETVRSTLDLNEIRNILGGLIGKHFKADRCFFIDSTFSLIDKSSEYRSSSDIESIFGYKFPENLTEMVDKNYKETKQDFIVTDIEVFLREQGLDNVFVKILTDFKVKSNYGIHIYFGDKFLGMIVLHYLKEKVNLPEEEIKLLQAIANQVGIAINQAKLLQETLKLAERERISKNIFMEVRATLDIDKMKNRLVEEIGKALHADRCFIKELDRTENKFLPIEYEYRSSPNLKSLIGLDLEKENPVFSELQKMKKEIIVGDIDEYILENQLIGTISEKYAKENEIKSAFSIPIIHAERLLGVLALHYTTQKAAFIEEELEFTKSIAGQLSIALHQGEVYHQTKSLAKREILLRKISETIRSSMNFNEVKKNIVEQVGKTFNADRCLIFIYDSETNSLSPCDFYSEYLSSPFIKSFEGFVFSKNLIDYLTSLMEAKISIIKPDVEIELAKSPEEHFLKEYFDKFNIKSSYVFPIFIGEKFFGVIILHYTTQKVKLDNNDIRVLESIANQASIALKQSLLYSKTQTLANRESLLRNVIGTIRSTLDVNQIKHNIVNEIGNTFNADRCFIIVKDPEDSTFSKIDSYSEYIFPSDIISMIGFVFDEKISEYFLKEHQQKKSFIIPDIENFLEQEADKPFLKEYFETLDVKSNYGFPLFSGGEFLGILVLHYTSKKAELDNQSINLLETVADQAGTAIKQSYLYLTTKKQAEKEALLRRVSEAFRSTLDINEIKRTIVTEIGKSVGANRVFLILYDEKTRTYERLDEYSEYLSSPKVKSIRSVEEPTAYEGFDYYEDPQIVRKIVYFSDLNQFLKEQNLEGTSLEEYHRTFGLKSSLGLPVIYANEILARLVIDFTEYKREITPSFIDFISIFANQAGIAIYQAKLFETLKKQAEREK